MATTVSPGRARQPVRGGRVRPVARLLVIAGATALAAVLAVAVPITRRDDGATSLPASPALLASARAAVAVAARTNDPDAYAEATRAVDALGDGPRDDVVRGVLALSLHDFDAADRFGRAALDAAPGDPDALTVLVDASVELGRYDVAQGYLEQLLERRPGPPALARLSYFRELHGDTPGALDAMDAAARDAESPADRATYLSLLGTLQLTSGALEPAAAAFEAAAVALPDHLPALVGRAQVRAARGDIAGAIEELDALTARSPQPAVATLLGSLLERAGDEPAATRAYALVTANARILSGAGVRTDLDVATFEARHGDPAAAVASAISAYDERQTVLTAATLGLAFTQAGRAAEGLRYVEEGLQLGTREPALRLGAAATYAALGRADEARAHLLIAFESTPWTDPSLVEPAASLAAQLGATPPPTWQD